MALDLVYGIRGLEKHVTMNERVIPGCIPADLGNQPPDQLVLAVHVLQPYRSLLNLDDQLPLFKHRLNGVFFYDIDMHSIPLGDIVVIEAFEFIQYIVDEEQIELRQLQVS